MKFVVKSTTKNSWLDLLCPYTCRGCGQLGEVVCERCKKNLLQAKLQVCPLCQQVLADAGKDGATWRDYKCQDCAIVLDAIFVGGWREGLLAKLVKEYKYQAVRAIGDVLVEVIDEAIPELPNDVVVVPLPTVGRHVRERGIDHTKVLAKKLAQKRGWEYQQLLRRAADTVQVGTKMAERHAQAKKAYMTSREILDGSKYYLLLDDVWTTGASMLAATEVLRAAGAKSVLGVVVAAGQQKSTSSLVD